MTECQTKILNHHSHREKLQHLNLRTLKLTILSLIICVVYSFSSFWRRLKRNVKPDILTTPNMSG